jgi:DNA-binding transcriptional MerR regulator
MKLYRVKEVCEKTGLTRKQLFDYKEIVRPTEYDQSGYKLYDSDAVEKLKKVAFYRGIDIPLKTIDYLINDPDADVEAELEKQIEVLRGEMEELAKKVAAAEEGLRR